VHTWVPATTYWVLVLEYHGIRVTVWFFPQLGRKAEHSKAVLDSTSSQVKSKVARPEVTENYCGTQLRTRNELMMTCLSRCVLAILCLCFNGARKIEKEVIIICLKGRELVQSDILWQTQSVLWCLRSTTKILYEVKFWYHNTITKSCWEIQLSTNMFRPSAVRTFLRRAQISGRRPVRVFSASSGKLSYEIVPKEDFGQYKEYSVIHTNRSLNLMSDPFQRVMRNLNDLLKETYNADKVAIIPGYVTLLRVFTTIFLLRQ